MTVKERLTTFANKYNFKLRDDEDAGAMISMMAEREKEHGVLICPRTVLSEEVCGVPLFAICPCDMVSDIENGLIDECHCSLFQRRRRK